MPPRYIVRLWDFNKEQDLQKFLNRHAPGAEYRLVLQFPSVISRSLLIFVWEWVETTNAT